MTKISTGYRNTVWFMKNGTIKTFLQKLCGHIFLLADKDLLDVVKVFFIFVKILANHKRELQDIFYRHLLCFGICMFRAECPFQQ